jgi:ribokinase
MIIVFGSLNIDMVMQVDHFPTAGETVLCPNDYLSRAGGKGANQAVAAVRAGGKVAMVGKVGDDSFGRRSINNLKRQSILTAGIGISERPTGCAMIAVNGLGHNQVITAPSANIDTTSDQIPDEILTPRNTVLTQLEVHPLETASVLSRAKRGGARTILNASPISSRHKLTLEVLQNVDYLIVNEVESRQLAEHLHIHEDDHVKRARALSEKAQLTAIITLEDKGAVAATPKETWQVNALKIEPLDTTGAGDTFCGIFASCLEAGFDVPASLHRASVGASMSCLGIGAQEAMPFMEEILAEMTKVAAPQLI